MATTLFVYGTLLAPELRYALLGRPFETTPAELDGYACFGVRQAPYPAITPVAGACTSGELISNLSASELDILDDYESAMYQRRIVTVRNAGGNDTAAFTYVIDESAAHRLSDEPWDYTTFRLHQLDRYLKAL